MAAFYEFFNEQKYADAVKNVSLSISYTDSQRRRWVTGGRLSRAGRPRGAKPGGGELGGSRGGFELRERGG